MKKFLRFIRAMMVACGWTFLFVYLFQALFVLIWNFDFTSDTSWEIMREYWNRGGIIKSPLDIALFAALALLPILWYIGLRKVLKIDYLRLIISPFDGFRRMVANKTSTERIVIRNIKSGEQRAEEIKGELSSLKPEKTQNAQFIRTEIREKRSDDK